MADPSKSLAQATADDLADALAFALRFQGRSVPPVERTFGLDHGEVVRVSAHPRIAGGWGRARGLLA